MDKTRAIIFILSDGSVVVRRPTQEFIHTMGSEDAALASEIARGSPDAVSSKIVAIADVPPDRAFRNAWKAGGTVVNVDMPKASVIHMDRIRVARNKQLEIADIELAKAADANNSSETARVKAKRQTLRDLPATFDLSGAVTPEELDVLWPVDELGER